MTAQSKIKKKKKKRNTRDCRWGLKRSSRQLNMVRRTTPPVLPCLSRSKYKAQSYRERTKQIGIYSQWSSCPNNAAGETKVGSVDKKVHGIRLSRQCQIKKKEAAAASRWKSTTGFFLFSFSLSFFLSLPLFSVSQAVRHTDPHTLTHTLRHTHLPQANTLTLILFLSPLSFLSFSLSHYVSLLLPSLFLYSPFFLLFAFAVCFALQPPPLSLSLYRSFAHSLPLHSFSPSLHFPPPPSLFCVCREREAIIWATLGTYDGMVERARNTAAAKRKERERERAQVADWLATALNKGPAEQIYGLRACKTKMSIYLLS